MYIDLKFAELQLFYLIVKIHKFLNMQEGQGHRRSRASKALPLDDLSGAVSAYYQRQIEPVVLDTIKKCGDHLSKDLA